MSARHSRRSALTTSCLVLLGFLSIPSQLFLLSTFPCPLALMLLLGELAQRSLAVCLQLGDALWVLVKHFALSSFPLGLLLFSPSLLFGLFLLPPQRRSSASCCLAASLEIFLLLRRAFLFFFGLLLGFLEFFLFLSLLGFKLVADAILSPPLEHIPALFLVDVVLILLLHRLQGFGLQLGRLLGPFLLYQTPSGKLCSYGRLFLSIFGCPSFFFCLPLLLQLLFTSLSLPLGP
mmetsp:Transcript_147275/g.382863  ORF Transcript_147275/g.382863 Transcript_147275/m.382863 type:complete len:234 (+) Transcript_147275:278-979(+)